jgi:hypothetical protein
LAALLFAVILLPSSSWAATTKNCPAEPAQHVPIVSGETYAGTNCVLNTTGDVDTYTFTAAAGDTWEIVLGLGASPKSDICLALYAPGSTTFLFGGCTLASASVDSVATIQKLAVAGTYTIVVTESANGTTFYQLSLERINPVPSDAIALTFSKVVTGEITPTVQDAYTFYGVTTGGYEISASYTGGSADVCFNVYQSGTSVLSGGPRCTAYFEGLYAIIELVNPEQDGTFLVIVYANGNDGTAKYDLAVSCLSGNGCELPRCVLTDASTYDATYGTLTMNFTVGTPVAATWNGWLVDQGRVQSMWSQPLPVTEPPKSVIKKKTGFAKSGVVGILSTFYTQPTTKATGGITCSSWQTISTGKP